MEDMQILICVVIYTLIVFTIKQFSKFWARVCTFTGFVGISWLMVPPEQVTTMPEKVLFLCVSTALAALATAVYYAAVE